jgi:hypothetical protein
MEGSTTNIHSVNFSSKLACHSSQLQLKQQPAAQTGGAVAKKVASNLMKPFHTFSHSLGSM